MPDQFRCEDCPEHSGTREIIRHLENDRQDCKLDRGKMWEQMDDHTRRIGERVTIKTAFWATGIAVTIFLTVITIILTTSSRVEQKVDELISDVEVLKAVSVERAIHAKEHSELLKEIRIFREQEAKDYQEGMTSTQKQQRYGKPEP